VSLHIRRVEVDSVKMVPHTLFDEAVDCVVDLMTNIFVLRYRDCIKEEV